MTGSDSTREEALKVATQAAYNAPYTDDSVEQARIDAIAVVDALLEAGLLAICKGETREEWIVEGEPEKWWPIDPVLIGDPPRGANFRKRAVSYGPWEDVAGVPFTDAEMAELRDRLSAARAGDEE